MNNGISMLNILNGFSRTLNIANQMIPIYKQLKPIINNSSKIIDNVKKVRFNSSNKAVISNGNIKPINYHYSSPTFFQ